MKKRFFCLVLALLMLVPMVLTGCSSKTTDEELAEVKDKASETAETITMFMITEQHVPTKAEVNTIKASKGETSKEYIEAKAKMEAYAAVGDALDKITKAKFRTHLVTTFYTIEEYQQVEKIMEQQSKSATMKEKIKKALRDYIRKKKQEEGIEDTAVIQSMFYEEFPEYKEFADGTTLAPNVTTVPETIIDSYGMEQLKYPDVRPNQVDIVCVCGYNNYVKYVEQGWLAALDNELEGNSKAILTYVNEKFLKSAMISGATYGIPNNTTVGEYTYLLINKERFDHYEYDYDSLPEGSAALASQDFLEFLKDIQRYDKEYAPISGDLEMTNELFWSLKYEYESVGKFTSAADLSDSSLYFSKTSDGTYRLLTRFPETEYTYATVKEAAFTGTAFEEGTYYYTKGSDGYYTLAKEYTEGTNYYTLEFTDIVPEEGKKFEEFESDVIYFQKVLTSSISYIPVYTFDANSEYYTVSEVQFDYNKFSVFGTVLPLGATLGTEIDPQLIKNNLYKNQILALKLIEENGYYDKDAVTYDESKDEYVVNKKFASAIIKGDASLADKYGKDYYMLVLEYPKANAEALCSNLLAVSSSCKNVSRAMQIITYINTNETFRNILQYGIENENYVLEEKVDAETGTAYKAVKRLNNNYLMSISKTGNMFIAYPEEGMSYKIWEYGKQQNSNAVYNPMLEFNISEFVSKIDFSVVDYFNAISAKYEQLINECTTRDELNEVLNNMTRELMSDPYYEREKEHGAIVFDTNTSSDPMLYNKYSLYNIYMNWWVTTEYFVPIHV